MAVRLSDKAEQALIAAGMSLAEGGHATLPAMLGLKDRLDNLPQHQRDRLFAHLNDDKKREEALRLLSDKIKSDKGFVADAEKKPDLLLEIMKIQRGASPAAPSSAGAESDGGTAPSWLSQIKEKMLALFAPAGELFKAGDFAGGIRALLQGMFNTDLAGLFKGIFGFGGGGTALAGGRPSPRMPAPSAAPVRTAAPAAPTITPPAAAPAAPAATAQVPVATSVQANADARAQAQASPASIASSSPEIGELLNRAPPPLSGPARAPLLGNLDNPLAQRQWDPAAAQPEQFAATKIGDPAYDGERTATLKGLFHFVDNPGNSQERGNSGVTPEITLDTAVPARRLNASIAFS